MREVVKGGGEKGGREEGGEEGGEGGGEGGGGGGSEASNRTEIYHDICYKWMGGSCLAKHFHNDNDNTANDDDAADTDAAADDDDDAILYASMLRADGHKIIIGQGEPGDGLSRNGYTPRLYNVNTGLLKEASLNNLLNTSNEPINNL
jgi:hypothetical protein